MKRCAARDCKKRFELDKWHPRKRFCSKCCEKRALYAANPEKGRAQQRALYAANPEKFCARARARRAANPEKTRAWKRVLRAASLEKVRAQTRARLVAYRERVFDLYGGKCACCNESDRRFLSIDHINNDGAEHRRAIKGGSTFYLWILRQPRLLRNLQLLCFNCNDAKQRFGGVCPHELDRRAIAACSKLRIAS